MSIRASLIKNIVVKKTMKELFDPTIKSLDSMRTESAKSEAGAEIRASQLTDKQQLKYLPQAQNRQFVYAKTRCCGLWPLVNKKDRYRNVP
jgi:hypothetical protein